MGNRIEQYEILIKVAETGSLTKTAEIMQYSQSNISHVISDLERDFGIPLFNRTRYGVELTIQAAQIIPLVQDVINRDRHLHQLTWSMTHRIAGKLRVGCFTSVNTTFLPTVIRKFTSQYTDVDLELHDGNFEKIASWLKRGSIDCTFLPVSYSSGLLFTPLIDDPLLAILPDGHPLTSKDVLTLEEVTSHPLIIQSTGGNYDVRHLLDNAGYPYKAVYAFDEDVTIMRMVEEGLGVAIIPELMMKNANRNIASRPLLPQEYRRLGIAVMQGQTSILTDAFTTFTKQYLAETGDYLMVNVD